MELREARKIAEYLAAFLKESCLRIEIAGSIRREKPEVKDIELVVIPRYESRGEASKDIFGNTAAPATKVNLLCEALGKLERIQWIKPNTSEIIEWPLKPTAKYIRGYIPSKNIKVDIFTATQENWGLIYAMRTGSADYSHKELASKWVRQGFHSKGGTLYKNGKPFPVPEEQDLFRLCKVPFLAPQLRH